MINHNYDIKTASEECNITMYTSCLFVSLIRNSEAMLGIVVYMYAQLGKYILREISKIFLGLFP